MARNPQKVYQVEMSLESSYTMVQFVDKVQWLLQGLLNIYWQAKSYLWDNFATTSWPSELGLLDCRCSKNSKYLIFTSGLLFSISTLINIGTLLFAAAYFIQIYNFSKKDLFKNLTLFGLGFISLHIFFLYL